MSLGQRLSDAGWGGKAIGLGISTGLSYDVLVHIAGNPGEYISDPPVAELARHLLSQQWSEANVTRQDQLVYDIFGRDYIDDNTIEQMDDAMTLAPARRGALMPDAHLGYGLPVGGVWGLEDAVSPWAVGVDIACRMRMTVFYQSPYMLGQEKNRFKEALLENTRFGPGSAFSGSDTRYHNVLRDPRWELNSLTRRLRDTVARPQLGSSGGGNHFVEFGSYVQRDRVDPGRPGSRRLALLSHSGSRKVGFEIANYYAKKADELCEGLGSKLGFLPLDSELGAEYWAAMQLAGAYAAANHQIIHDTITMYLGLDPIKVIENHHNFAWKEVHEGKELVVHRKGATPAAQGQLGIIPGTMSSTGYVVSGRGYAPSLNSASHGAGRTMSRRGALRTLSEHEWLTTLQENGVTLMGGTLDESPQAYKDIEQVIMAQSDLVDVVGEFSPKIVRMAND